jgi:site-specific DNA-methyltransferase (adenine-specific)
MPLLLQGDCLEVMRDLSDHSVDCFICDLPYGQLSPQRDYTKEPSGSYAARQTNLGIGRCAWDVKIDLAAFWVQVKRLSRNDHTPVLMFCNTKFGIDLINSNPSWFRYDLVWDKGRGVSFLLANKMPMKSHEMIYVFSKKGSFYNRIDISGDFALSRTGGKGQSKQYGVARTHTNLPNGFRCALSVIPAISSTGTGKHPTEKPVALYRWLLERYCPEGGTVLDPTAGSFNAILAAEALGLHGIGIEKDEGFFKTGCAKFTDTSGNIIEIV